MVNICTSYVDLMSLCVCVSMWGVGFGVGGGYGGGWGVGGWGGCGLRCGVWVEGLGVGGCSLRP